MSGKDVSHLQEMVLTFVRRKLSDEESDVVFV